MKTDLIFYFEFSFDDNSELYGFLIPSKNVQNYLNMDELINESWYEEFLDEKENDVGVHDWSTTGEEVDAIGYTSYEVEKKDVLPLMKGWVSLFKKHLKIKEKIEIKQLDINLLSSEEIYLELKK